MELESQVPAFRQRGLEVAALSYDPVAVLKDFATRRNISFPLLSDPDSVAIRAFGLLNPEFTPGHYAHGVPHPGTLVVDERGIVRERYFEKAYTDRRTAAGILALQGELPASPATEVSGRGFQLRLSASNARAAPGQRLTLVLDFEMEPGMHAYAPGAERYRALAVRLDPHPLLTAHEAVLPASRPFFFAPLEETVPVFEARFRVLQDVTLAPGRAFAELLRSPGPRVTITGTLDHQVCSDTVCHPPASLPLAWTIEVTPLERERPPEPLQRKLS